MKRSIKQKVAAGAAVAVVVAGGSVAAVAATGQSSGHKASSSRGHAHWRDGRGFLAGATQRRSRGLSTVSSYLGLTDAQVQSDLRSGKTLAQIADSTSGKSSAGLIDALVASEKARLDKASANLTKRVTEEVDGSTGRGLLGAGALGHSLLGHGPRDLGTRGATGATGARHSAFGARGALAFVADSYLGLTAQQLYSDLKSGRTLGQIADATSGKSAAGLVNALVAARKEQLAVGVTAGLLTPASEATIVASLPARMTALVGRNFSK